MKYLLVILLFCGSLKAQLYNPINNTLLDGWVFDGDTTIIVPTVLNYKWIVGIECNSLTGTLDGNLKIKGKYMDEWVYMSIDTVIPSPSNQLINDANYFKIVKCLDHAVDSLKLELYNNNITGGTVKLKLKRY